MVDCPIGCCYSSYLTFFLIREAGQARFCFREQVLVVFSVTKGFENKYYPRWRFFFKLRMTFCRHEDTDIPLLLKSKTKAGQAAKKKRGSNEGCMPRWHPLDRSLRASP